MRVEMTFSTPDTHENEWQLILEAKVDDAMAGRGFRRSGPVNWELPPWNHYLNGKSAPPGYVEVSFEAELIWR